MLNICAALAARGGGGGGGGAAGTGSVPAARRKAAAAATANIVPRCHPFAAPPSLKHLEGQADYGSTQWTSPSHSSWTGSPLSLRAGTKGARPRIFWQVA